jgi:serine/threonine protein kinase
MVWAAGHQLQNGKYVIREVLGQGGFGITYKVRHVRLETFVVIKTPNEYLRHDPDYAKYVERFIREGQMMERFSQRSHPHIVRVRDLFEEGDIPCMAMDFVEGENLFQWVRRKGALAEAEILPCIRQMGEALASIHQAGLVHRDAHPGNIMRCKDGRAVLIDFGIAKELVPSTQSSAGTAGNRGFAPYEQMFQGSRDVTVDIYCLAASLYFAVTGQRPAEAIARKLNNTLLIPPQRHNRRLSDHVNQAILNGMELESTDRPRSMQDWLQLLEIPKTVPSPIQPVSPSSRERITATVAAPSPAPAPRIPSPVLEVPDFLQRRRIQKNPG